MVLSLVLVIFIVLLYRVFVKKMFLKYFAMISNCSFSFEASPIFMESSVGV